jgi:hypothetical protein
VIIIDALLGGEMIVDETGANTNRRDPWQFPCA